MSETNDDDGKRSKVIRNTLIGAGFSVAALGASCAVSLYRDIPLPGDVCTKVESVKINGIWYDSPSQPCKPSL